MVTLHRTRAVASVAAVVFLSACPPTGDGPPDDVAPDFDRGPLLAHAADNIIVPTLETARDDVAVLVEMTRAHRDAVESSGDVEGTKAAAELAWRQVFETWSRVDVMQVGPAGKPGMTMGGRALRDEVYSWPTVSPCAVDQTVLENGFESEGYFVGKLVNVKGLDAIEYVLFTSTRDNACPSAASINTSGDWAALSTEEVTVRRARFAAAAAVDVAANIDAILEGWSSYRDAFVGENTDLYSTKGAAVDDLVGALFFIDLVTKDQKFAIPAGLSIDCPETTCPDDLEARFAQTAKVGLIENVSAFAQVFRGTLVRDGTDGIGFDDFLAAAKADDLADAIDDAIVNFETKMNVLSDPMTTELSSNHAAVVEAYEALKAITDELKSQFVTVLNVKAPEEGAGDND